MIAIRWLFILFGFYSQFINSATRNGFGLDLCDVRRLQADQCSWVRFIQLISTFQISCFSIKWNDDDSRRPFNRYNVVVWYQMNFLASFYWNVSNENKQKVNTPTRDTRWATGQSRIPEVNVENRLYFVRTLPIDTYWMVENKVFEVKAHQNKQKKWVREIFCSTASDSQCIPVDRFYLVMRIWYFQSNYLEFRTTHTCEMK